MTGRLSHLGSAKLVVSGLGFAAIIAGCSAIVGDTVPDFSCSIDAPGVCPTGLHCDVVSQKCVVGDDATPAGDTNPPGNDSGDGNTLVDTGTDSDATTGPLPLGSPCRVADDCQSKLCGTSTALTPTITGTTGPICTTPCCTSPDCPSGFVCFNGGTGGAYCVEAALASRTPSANGGAMAGTTCSANSDCRSGLCGGPVADSEPSTFSVCIDTCCADRECATGTLCRVAQVEAPAPAHSMWICAPHISGDTSPPGSSSCGSSFGFTCETNACSGNVCRPPCSGNASCQAISGFEDGICFWGSSPPDVISFCLESAPTSGNVALDGACTANSQCETDYCDDELHVCKNVCAKDSDCEATEACLPCGVNTPYLRCVPKPL